jgi:hypothetical protein
LSSPSFFAGFSLNRESPGRLLVTINAYQAVVRSYRGNTTSMGTAPIAAIRMLGRLTPVTQPNALVIAPLENRTDDSQQDVRTNPSPEWFTILFADDRR